MGGGKQEKQVKEYFEDEIIKSACREKGTILTRHVSEKEFLYTFLRKTEWKIGQPFNISYIENGAPVVFCLSETPPFRVVIGERYINYVTLIHRLLGDDIQGEMLSEQSRRLGLTIMAEFALRYGNTDYAV